MKRINEETVKAGKWEVKHNLNADVHVNMYVDGEVCIPMHSTPDPNTIVFDFSHDVKNVQLLITAAL